jgi:arylsulfatase A-like enzyme
VTQVHPWPPWARRALGLGLAGLLAKGLVLAARAWDGGTGVEGGAWAALALVYQDALAGLRGGAGDGGTARALAGRDRLVAWRERSFRVLYALVVAWVAVNVPLARLFGTPATWPFLAAAGGALADSIALHATPLNLGAIALVAGVGWAFPLFPLPAWRRRTPLCWALGLLLVVVGGHLGRGRSDTLGLHRQPAWALVESALRRQGIGVGAAPVAASNLLASDGEALDLSHFRGSAGKRSVIWVILESTGARHLGLYGADPDPMPQLRQLAERALVFDRVSAVHPESIKTLFSMLCATWPASHLPAEALVEARVPCAAVAQVFSDAGYRTGLFHSGRFAYLGMREVIAHRGFDVLADADVIRGEHYSSFGTDDRATMARVLAFIDEAPTGQPFFVVAMPIAGHHPYRSPGDGPRPFPADTERGDHRNDLFAGDHALGMLIRGIAERGLGGEVVWLVNGDHGEAFHEHPGNFAHSLFVYEENLQVPVVLAIPGATPRAVRVPQVGSLVDLAPTLVALAGLDVPARWQGRSLLEPEPGLAFGYVDHAQWLGSVRDGRWKLVADLETDRALLFDLATDPAETRDLSAGEPERTARYLEAVKAWAFAQRRFLEAYPSRSSD